MASPSRSPLTLDDLIADLVWPRLLRVGRLAIRPARIGLGTFYLIGCIVLIGAAGSIDGRANANVLYDSGAAAASSVAAAARGLVTGDIAAVSSGLRRAFIQQPITALRQAPLATLLIAPLLLVWTVVIGAAISRTAGTELAIHRTTSWPEAVGMALRRWRTLAAAAILPLLLLWTLVLVLSVAGWALFSLAWVNALGGLLWGLFLLGGLIGAVLIVGAALGHGLVLPGVMCEGSDAIDAVQHAYSMALGRPLRLAAYAALLAVQGLVLAVIILVVIHISVELSLAAAGSWSGERGRGVLGAASMVDPDAATPPPTDTIASTLVRRWTDVFRLAGAGAIVSYIWCALTGLFLVMRRVCDGQEISELWSPGMVPCTTAPSVQAAESPSSTIAAPARTEAITDNGPADEG